MFAAPARLSVRDLLDEALAGVTQRPGRAALTMLGTVLGVGAFVAVLGLTATASSQIGHQFNVLNETTVTVTDDSQQEPGNGGSKRTGVLLDDSSDAFPSDASRRVRRLNGVVAAGVWWQVRFDRPPVVGTSPIVQAGSAADTGGSTALFAASPDTFAAMRARISHGVAYNSFHESRGEAVCILGSTTARRLGVVQLAAQPAVFVNGRAFSVLGIMDETAHLPEMLNGIVIPTRTSRQVFGPPSVDSPAQMLIRTRLGAARLIAAQAPRALRPDDPRLLSAAPPPDPHSLRDKVDNDLGGLFLVLACICLLIGAVGIANTVFVAVLERTAEIGLRRALGARPRHIALQFLSESTALGLLGGMIGTATGIGVVAGVSLLQGWTVVLDPATVLPAPLIGAVTGFAAGLYPSLRAARIEPQEALRQ